MTPPITFLEHPLYLDPTDHDLEGFALLGLALLCFERVIAYQPWPRMVRKAGVNRGAPISRLVLTWQQIQRIVEEAPELLTIPMSPGYDDLAKEKDRTGDYLRDPQVPDFRFDHTSEFHHRLFKLPEFRKTNAELAGSEVTDEHELRARTYVHAHATGGPLPSRYAAAVEGRMPGALVDAVPDCLARSPEYRLALTAMYDRLNDDSVLESVDCDTAWFTDVSLIVDGIVGNTKQPALAEGFPNIPRSELPSLVAALFNQILADTRLAEDPITVKELLAFRAKERPMFIEWFRSTAAEIEAAGDDRARLRFAQDAGLRARNTLGGSQLTRMLCDQLPKLLGVPVSLRLTWKPRIGGLRRIAGWKALVYAERAKAFFRRGGASQH